MQHDCRTCNCQPGVARAIRQERVDTTQTVLDIQHTDDECYVINLHAFHNAALVRKVLPSELARPRPQTENRASWLQEKGEAAQVLLAKSREEANKKRAATRAKNIASKQGQAGKGKGKKKATAA